MNDLCFKLIINWSTTNLTKQYWFLHSIPISRFIKFLCAHLLLEMMEQLSFLIAEHDATHLTNSPIAQKTINVSSLWFYIILFLGFIRKNPCHFLTIPKKKTKKVVVVYCWYIYSCYWVLFGLTQNNCCLEETCHMSYYSHWWRSCWLRYENCLWAFLVWMMYLTLLSLLYILIYYQNGKFRIRFYKVPTNVVTKFGTKYQ